MWCDTKYSQVNTSWAQQLTALGLENIFHETCVGGDVFKECQSIVSVMGKIMADPKTFFFSLAGMCKKKSETSSNAKKVL